MKFNSAKKEYISTRISGLTSGGEGEHRRESARVLCGHKSICISLMLFQYDPDSQTECYLQHKERNSHLKWFIQINQACLAFKR